MSPAGPFLKLTKTKFIEPNHHCGISQFQEWPTTTLLYVKRDPSHFSSSNRYVALVHNPTCKPTTAEICLGIPGTHEVDFCSIKRTVGSLVESHETQEKETVETK